MVTVALLAFGVFKILPRLFMWRIIEEITVVSMAFSAGGGDRCQVRRRGAVVAMAIIAGRGRIIPLLEYHFPMYRFGVLLVLICGDRFALILVFLHEQRTAVTLSTGFRDVIVVNHTPRVGGRQNVMNPMAISTDRSEIFVRTEFCGISPIVLAVETLKAG